MHIQNVHIHLGGLGTIAALSAALFAPSEPSAAATAGPTGKPIPPRIGDHWQGQGGIYAGIVRGEEGQPDYHLVLSAAKPEDTMSWDKAVEWGKTATEEGHTDFQLPTKRESALLYANLQDQFEDGWHWTGTQYSSDDAWSQYFADGDQDDYGEKFEARARAVRRLIL